MAVEDKYVVDAVEAGNVGTSLETRGAGLVVLCATEEIAAADEDGSVYRFFKGVNPALRPVKIDIVCDAITSGSDYDLGLYLSDSGAVLDKDCLMDGQSLASASTLIAPLNGMGAVGKEDIGKTLYDLLATPEVVGAIKGGYDIALTANTVGSAAGTVTIIGYFAEGSI